MVATASTDWPSIPIGWRLRLLREIFPPLPSFFLPSPHLLSPLPPYPPLALRSRPYIAASESGGALKLP